MFAYVIRRLLATIPVMGVVAIFVFSLLYITPGDPAAVIAGDIATAEDIARIHHQLGLDEPFLWRFGGWLWGVLRGDLGISIFTNLPVAQLIGQRLEPTLALTTTALVVTVIFAIPLGVIAAWKVGTWIDRGVMIFAVIGFSLPAFVLAYLLISGFLDRARLAAGAGLCEHSRGVRALHPAFDLAEYRLGPDLWRSHRAHHPSQHARSVEPRLYPHGSSEGSGQ